MSLAVDDIWDLPAENSTSSHETVSTNQDSLFLDGTDDEEGQGATDTRRVQRAMDPEVEAVFRDMDDIENGSSTPVRRIDFNAMNRAAEAKARSAVPKRSQIPSTLSNSSPAKDDPFSGLDGGAEEDKAKQKRKPMRLDENLLLGPTGFLQLIKDTEHFHMKGKGHEVSDLNRLLQVYQFWTHRMFPKTQFRDTVHRVEKLCHSKRMHVALSAWRDEVHGISPEKEPSEEDNTASMDTRQDSSEPTESSLTRPQSDNSSPRPPSSAPDMDLDGAGRLDEGHQTSSGPPTSRDAAVSEEEFDDLYAEFGDELAEQDQQVAPPVTRPLPEKPMNDEFPDDDEAFWIAAATEVPPAPQHKAKEASGDNLDDDDLWAMMDQS